MKRYAKFLTLLTVVVWLSGCGLKGDLYFPADEQQSTTTNESK
ncbi:LPS translocon maturation chaperone LptM [Zophobihabitans entericus]|uniref:Lipoprotein n=1 Tax=Zophobihabitans entericus TaxID=1635327 RepID=A0A6G9ICG9_9GAMM|nr:hypothetical protein IPMB12_06020 [Zophobihabitans entericus]